VDERLKKAEELSRGKRDLFWHYFFSEELLELDEPNPVGIANLLDRASRGLIAIVTGRPRRLYRATVEQLKRVGIPLERIWRICMRRDNDRRKSPIVKLEMVLELMYEGYEIAEIHDDDEEFLELATKRIPSAELYIYRGTLVEKFRRYRRLL